MKTVQKIIAWSPSRLFMYEECPAKTKYKVIHKLKEPENPAASRGSMIDKAAEDAIKGRKKPTKLIPELHSVKQYLQRYQALHKAKKARTQLELAFDSKWKLVDWFAREAWARMKLDVLLLPKKDESEVVDLKSGKLRTEDGHKYEAQVRAYNVAVISAGLAKKSSAALLFTDHNVLHVPPKNSVLTLDGLKKEQRYWEDRVRPMFEDRLFAPRPGRYCGYCHFRKGNNGPCKY